MLRTRRGFTRKPPLANGAYVESAQGHRWNVGHLAHDPVALRRFDYPGDSNGLTYAHCRRVRRFDQRLPESDATRIVVAVVRWRPDVPSLNDIDRIVIHLGRRSVSGCHCCRVDEWLERRARLAVSVQGSIERAALELPPAAESPDVAVPRIDCHHCALNEGAPTRFRLYR